MIFTAAARPALRAMAREMGDVKMHACMELAAWGNDMKRDDCIVIFGAALKFMAGEGAPDKPIDRDGLMAVAVENILGKYSGTDDGGQTLQEANPGRDIRADIEQGIEVAVEQLRNSPDDDESSD
jgi:hypothetical protein